MAEPMSDIADHVKDAVEVGRDSKLNTAIAVLVSITATFIAMCNVKDGNIGQAMAQAQASSIDAWAYYQAKGTKQHLAESMVDELTIQRDLLPGAASPEAHALLDRKIAEYAARAKLYESEKAKIKQSAEGFQSEYDRLNFHDDQFDMADATLSLSIALLGVTALTRKRWLFVVGAAFALFGMALGISGFLGYGFHPDVLAKLLS
jgi:hypothetical protein